jgi:dTDP-glucose 4,6-dehydratase
MEQQTILVTGGAGFIGSNFIRYALNQDPDLKIVNLDLLTYAGSLENLRGLPDPDRHLFVRGDICDANLVGRLLRAHQIDTIVNFAAESHVDRSISGPMPFVQTNIVGTTTLLDEARRYWLEEQRDSVENVRFHQISTDEVFGSLSLGEQAWTEETPYSPNSPYAASKAASDHLVRAYAHTYRLPVTITNCSNNYGPYQFPEKLIPLMIQNALQGKTLPVYGDGQQIRDWLYVTDHCQAIWLVLLNGKVGETYNIGGDNQPTNIDLVKHICEILDELVPDSPQIPHKQLITFVKDRPGHDLRYDMDFSKIKKELDWEPVMDLARGLRETVAWYLDSPDWMEAIQNRPDFQEWEELNYKNRVDK